MPSRALPAAALGMSADAAMASISSDLFTVVPFTRIVSLRTQHSLKSSRLYSKRQILVSSGFAGLFQTDGSIFMPTACPGVLMLQRKKHTGQGTTN